MRNNRKIFFLKYFGLLTRISQIKKSINFRKLAQINLSGITSIYYLKTSPKWLCYFNLIIHNISDNFLIDHFSHSFATDFQSKSLKLFKSLSQNLINVITISSHFH